MSNISQRTQIILPKHLRERIEKDRAKTGESLGEYLRKAAEERLKREQAKKLNLKKLAREFIGIEKNNSLKREEVIEWQRQLRRESDRI